MKPIFAKSPSGWFTANRYDRLEWAGAFGDLGTLIPFVAAYISLLKVDPYGVLLAFGLAKIASGLYYKTPFPVQPMKAIGAVATTAQTAAITPHALYGAGIVTGLVWLLLGITGTTEKIARAVSRSVVLGIILGLGFNFMSEGIKMISTGWVLGSVALAGTLLLLGSRKVPVMFLLLLFGAIAALVQDQRLAEELRHIEPVLRLPSFALTDLTGRDYVIGAVFLALPQVPLTLGNAIIAVTAENNDLFPDRAVTERKVSISTGIMNLLGAAVGGVPMCHGAGGMAGHVRFGARTGGSLVILGVIVLLVAVFFSSSVETVFRIFPVPVLGVILFLTGAQLALGSCDFGKADDDRFVGVVTAAVATWNIGAAFVIGVVLSHLIKRGLIKL